MAHSQETQMKFVDLRSQGLSFDKIAAELGVTKPTLIKWQVEFQYEISTAEYLETDALLEKHKVHRRARMELAASRLEKVSEAIEAKDFGKEKLSELFAMEKDLLKVLAGSAGESRGFAGQYKDDGVAFSSCLSPQPGPVLKIDKIF